MTQNAEYVLADEGRFVCPCCGRLWRLSINYIACLDEHERQIRQARGEQKPCNCQRFCNEHTRKGCVAVCVDDLKTCITLAEGTEDWNAAEEDAMLRIHAAIDAQNDCSGGEK